MNGAAFLFAKRGLHGQFPSIAERIDASGDCWLWMGGTDGKGYGTVNIVGYSNKVHRVVWEALVGPIAEELEIDHLCRVCNCVNPDHLEPVTHAENIRRGATGRMSGAANRAKTHCPRGHPYVGRNLIVRLNGYRRCRICKSNQERAGRLRRKGRAA